ncbi:hypothetical protein OGM63_12800 [Plectonema radiosum NIES-515]|uniref:Uncharacterized protein n=1 Tax=Plectonema radiosum NIES-515 TaxID=2986073 RepID=A0ABT3AZ21_9CYAN|nr:hypothetical protein [Plectonema radiosum]MCV3214379.1 hypothetical protein [Plectonema radiosum NIES-515]
MRFDLSQETDPQLLGNLGKITRYDLIVVDTPLVLRSEVLAPKAMRSLTILFCLHPQHQWI